MGKNDLHERVKTSLDSVPMSLRSNGLDPSCDTWRRTNLGSGDSSTRGNRSTRGAMVD